MTSDPELRRKFSKNGYRRAPTRHKHADLALFLREHGFQVYIKPLSEDSNRGFLYAERKNMHVVDNL